LLILKKRLLVRFKSLIINELNFFCETTEIGCLERVFCVLIHIKSLDATNPNLRRNKESSNAVSTPEITRRYCSVFLTASTRVPPFLLL